MNINNRFFQLIVLRTLLFVGTIYNFFFSNGDLTSLLFMLFITSFFIKTTELEQGWIVFVIREIKESWFVLLSAFAFFSLKSQALLYYADLPFGIPFLKIVLFIITSAYLYHYFSEEDDKVIRGLKTVVFSIIIAPFSYSLFLVSIDFSKYLFGVAVEILEYVVKLFY